MATVTISKKITKGEELVIIPRKEYERLIASISSVVPIYTPTHAEKKALVRARKNRARGNFLTLNELKQKLGFRN